MMFYPELRWIATAVDIIAERWLSATAFFLPFDIFDASCWYNFETGKEYLIQVTEYVEI